MPKELILIGGGSSLSEGIKMGLWDKLSNKFVISCNYAYNDFPTATLSTYVDQDYYKAESKKELFQKLPLIIGKRHSMKILPNTIMLNAGATYNRNLKNGVFKSSLCGLFSLSLGIYLLDVGTIYLLGFDFGNIRNEKDSNKKFKTHYYQEDEKREHRGCFDKKTEILTENGWRNCKTINKEDKIYSLNLKTNNIELANIINFYNFKEKGYWQVKNRKKYFIFNKNHKILYQTLHKNKKILKSLNNIKFPKQFGIPISHNANLGEKISKYKNWKIKPFLRFLGLWFADGCIVKSRKLTAFGFNKEQSKKYLEKQLKEIDIKYSKSKNKNRPTSHTYQICDKELYNELKNLGNVYTKKIPNWIFNLSPNLIQEFVDGFIEGDGCRRKRGGREQETLLIGVNYILLSQFQHLLFLCGIGSNLHKRSSKERKIEGRILKQSICYILTIKKLKYLFVKSNKDIQWKSQLKNFWGITINKNHTIFIRRNGLCMWTGNTGRINYYCTKNRADKDFSNYLNEKQVKIYNVSLNSNINVLPKLSYSHMYKLLDNTIYCQQDLRYNIIQKLKKIK